MRESSFLQRPIELPICNLFSLSFLVDVGSSIEDRSALKLDVLHIDLLDLVLVSIVLHLLEVLAVHLLVRNLDDLEPLELVRLVLCDQALKVYACFLTVCKLILVLLIIFYIFYLGHNQLLGESDRDDCSFNGLLEEGLLYPLFYFGSAQGYL